MLASVILCSLECQAQGSAAAVSPRRGAKARPVTAGEQFQKSVAELLKSLYACQPHYIRTIKPNDEKRPLGFTDARVLEQVRYLGLLENLRVRRAGFCYRTTYERWLKRYGLVCNDTFPSWGGAPRDGVKKVMDAIGASSSAYQFGKTKIFIKEPQTLYSAEDARLKKLEAIAATIRSARLPKAGVTEGNICLEYLRVLVFEELDEVTIYCSSAKSSQGPETRTYKAYPNLENDYIAKQITPSDLKNSLYKILTDQWVEVGREHFKQKKSGGGFMKSFLRFFGKGKAPTASLSRPK